MSELLLTAQNSPGALGANLAAFYIDATGEPTLVGNDAVPRRLLAQDADGSVQIDGAIELDYVNALVNGPVTINQSAGRVTANIGATNLQVNCNYCSNTSHVFAIAGSNDSTGRVTAVVPGAGNFVIHMTAPAANMPINFVVL